MSVSQDDFIFRVESVGLSNLAFNKSKYTGSKKPVIVTCLRHGDFNATPESLYRGRGCYKCGRESTGDAKRLSVADVLGRFKNKHGDTYKYIMDGYTGIYSKIGIVCRYHGLFYQSVKNHFKGQRCPKCSRKARADNSRLTTERVVQQFKNRHGDRYDYSLVKYTSDVDKVSIICKKHGVFQQAPTNHKFGQNCPLCNQPNFSTRDDYIKICSNTDGKSNFYVIHCYGENESFYKIGITKHGLTRRFAAEKHMPYKYDVVLSLLMDAGDCWDVEVSTKELLRSNLYAPTIFFNGSRTECFSSIDLIQDFINENT